MKLVHTQTHVEQVIDVPKISQDRIQCRLVDGEMRQSQMAEQLVEVPTILSLSLLQRAEQIVGNPAPRGRRGRRGGGVQNLFPAENSTAPVSPQIVDIPVRSGGLQGFRP